MKNACNEHICGAIFWPLHYTEVAFIGDVYLYTRVLLFGASLGYCGFGFAVRKFSVVQWLPC